MKTKLLTGALLAVVSMSSLQAQEFGIATGIQSVEGEVSEYNRVVTSFTSISATWDISTAVHWRPGVELRYASMSINPNIEEGWLSNYYADGNDFSVMGTLRYYFNTPGNFYKRRKSFLYWTHAAVGFHLMNYQSVETGTGIHSTSAKMGELSQTRSAQSGALELGAGAQYYFTDNWSISLSGGFQYTGNDYLDGVVGIGKANDWPFYLALGGAYRIF